MRCFMPGIPTPLYATIRQRYGARSEETTVTSEERREARYQRRKAHRVKKKQEQYGCCDCFDSVFSYGNLYSSYRKCRKNVAWKSSVQRYITQAPLIVEQTYQRLQSGRFRTSGFVEFNINERGKTRHIRSVTINERVVQRTLCDYAIVPMLSRSFVYDNGASRIGKGYSFAIRRLTQHLQEHYRKFGTDGYILLFDFSKFFDSVSHELVKSILRKQFSDERILRLTDHFIDAFGDTGLGLGSQISQILALASADRLDHFVKEICRIRGYGRYMDDGYLIHPDKDYLRQCLDGMRAICDELGIRLNEKKTQIVKIAHGFTWLKVKFFLLPSGRVVRKMNRGSITKARQKLKALRRMVDAGKLTYDDVYASWQSWQAYSRQFDAYRTRQSVGKSYDDLFVMPMLNHT